MDLRSCLQPEMGQGPDTERRLVAHRHARHRNDSRGANHYQPKSAAYPGASTVFGPGGTAVFRSAGNNPLHTPGPVDLVIDPNQNLSGAIFEGLDYEAIYILDSTIFGGGDWGRLTTTVNGTWLSRARLQVAPGDKAIRYRWSVRLDLIPAHEFVAMEPGELQYIL